MNYFRAWRVFLAGTASYDEKMTIVFGNLAITIAACGWTVSMLVWAML